MAIRLADIAKKTGFSVSTVSRALHSGSSKYKISQDTIKKIKKVAEELGYRTDKIARGLKLKRTLEIGVVVPDILNPFFATLVKSISKEVRKIGYTIMLCDSDETPQIEEEAIEHLLEKRVEGLIISAVGIHFNHIKALEKYKLPIVVVDRLFHGLKFDSVCVDNFKGALKATEYLVREGHRKIAIIQGLPGTSTNDARLSGYKTALNNANIAINFKYIVGDDFRRLNGYLQTKTLLKLDDPPTAIFTASDLIAIGAIQAIKEENMKIPDDISIVTFDDPRYVSHLSPPLTAVRQPVTEIGIIAVKLLTNRMKSFYDQIKQICLEPQLIVRNSVIHLKIGAPRVIIESGATRL